MILNSKNATSTLLSVGNDGVLVNWLDGERVQDPNLFEQILLREINKGGK
jgi:hypothetical protein